MGTRYKRRQTDWHPRFVRQNVPRSGRYRRQCKVPQVRSRGTAFAVSLSWGGMPLSLLQTTMGRNAEFSIRQWISFATRAGHLQSIGANPNYFSDRFQLGGPLSVRSFRTNSMGPRDGRRSQIRVFGVCQTLMLMQNIADSLGGNVHWSAGISLISNVPTKGHWPVKTHVFINAGRLDAMDKCLSFSRMIFDTR
jgi:outer membrane protein insertion porin family